MKRIWDRCKTSLLIHLSFFPVLSVLVCINLPDLAWQMVFLHLICCLLSLGISQIGKGKLRSSLFVVLCFAITGLSTYIFFPQEEWIAPVLMTVFLNIPIWLCMHACSGTMKIQTRFVISTLGLVAYALEQVLLFQSQRSVMLKDLPILLVPIRLYFLLDALLVLLFSNQEALEGANIGLRRIPEHICAINRLLSVMMLLVTIILSFIPQIGDALYRLYTLVKRGIVSLVAFLSRFLPEMGQQGGGGGGAGEMMMGAEETQEPSLLWTILEKVFMVLAFAVLLVLVFFLLRTLFRKLRMWIRKLLGRMQEFLRDASEDYEDEVFDTRSGDGESRERGGQRRRGRKRIRESELSPRELIRYRYARFLSQHPAADPGVTAREQIRSDQASLYEKARYSEHPVNAEEASEFSPELT